jgi:cobalt-precorrin-5B (C1)-methyltransferase
VRSANTALEVLELTQAARIDLATTLAAKARMVASEACDRAVNIEILIYDRKGGLVGHADFAKP